MANISTPQKSPGDQHFASEVNQQTDWINSPGKILGIYNPLSVTLDSSGTYTNYTPPSDLIVIFSGTPVNKNWQKVQIVLDGIKKILIPNNSIILDDSFEDDVAPAAGTYDLYHVYIDNEYQFKLIKKTVVLVASPTLSTLTISNDYTYTDLVIDQGIYGASDSSTPAALSDLSIVFAANGGTATGWTASSVKQNDSTTEGSASALVGGETTVRIFGAIIGTPDGQETLTVGPTDGSSLYNARGQAMSVSESVSANFVSISWTTFNGTSTHTYFGNILGSVICGADKKWAFEIRLRNWTEGSLQRVWTSYTDTNWNLGEITILIDTTQHIEVIAYGTTISQRIYLETASQLTNANTLIRIEYDGSIDTDQKDRFDIKFNGTSQTLADVSPISFPFDITDKTINYTTGAARLPNGTLLGSYSDGDAASLKIQSTTDHITYVDELDVPDLTSGTDVSGNNLNGTFVA